MMQLENNLAICLILTGNEIITVKITIHFLSPIVKLTKVNTEVNTVLTFIQCPVEGKNFGFSAISNIRCLELFCWSRGSSRWWMSTVFGRKNEKPFVRRKCTDVLLLVWYLNEIFFEDFVVSIYCL